MTRYTLTALTCVLALVVAAEADATRPSSSLRSVSAGHIHTRSSIQEETVLCRYRGHTLSVTTPTGTTRSSGAPGLKRAKTHKGLFVLYRDGGTQGSLHRRVPPRRRSLVAACCYAFFHTPLKRSLRAAHLSLLALSVSDAAAAFHV